MKRHVKKLLAALLLAAAVLLFVPVMGDTAEAQSVKTEDYGGGWKWDFSDGARYEGYFARVINKKSGAMLKNGWHKVDGYWFYFEKGGYIFDEYHDGNYVGIPECGGYHEDNEPMTYDWKKVSGKWRYQSTDGEYLTSTWARIDGKIYHFDDNGFLYKAGWRYNEDFGWFFVNKDGSAKTGWYQEGGKWYFFNYYSGLMWIGGVDTSPVGKAGKSYYFFDEDYTLMTGTGWVNLYETYWAYLNKDGTCRTGWIKDGKKWYYLDPVYAGEMTRSWIYEDTPEDSMYVFVDGYYIDDNGVCRDGGYDWHKDGNKGWWYGKGKYYIKNMYGYIDGMECKFDKNGYVIYTMDLRTRKMTYYQDVEY